MAAECRNSDDWIPDVLSKVPADASDALPRESFSSSFSVSVCLAFLSEDQQPKTKLFPQLTYL